MKRPGLEIAYEKHIRSIFSRVHKKDAMSLAVGGDFKTVGKLEAAFLIQNGLQREHTVIDVGCGSGRLAYQLSGF